MSQKSKIKNDTDLESLLRKSSVVVLRLNHRPRDKRVTTHVCLTARAFGANGVIIADTSAGEIVNKVNRLNRDWGNEFWVIDSLPTAQAIKLWRSMGGTTINLSMYGEDLRTVISDLYYIHYILLKPILVIVGGAKVPSQIYEEADYNVSITDQPHSEIAALAVFLDKLVGGKWPQHRNGRIKVIPSLKGKGRINITGGLSAVEKTNQTGYEASRHSL